MYVFDHLSRITFVAVLGLILAAPSADAQGRMGGGRGGPHGGPGVQGQAGARGPQVSGTVPGVQLSAAQRQRVAAIRRETQQQVQAIRRNPNLSAQQRAQRIAEARQRGHQRVLDVLTPAQRRQFQQWWANRGG